MKNKPLYHYNNIHIVLLLKITFPVYVGIKLLIYSYFYCEGYIILEYIQNGCNIFIDRGGTNNQGSYGYRLFTFCDLYSFRSPH